MESYNPNLPIKASDRSLISTIHDLACRLAPKAAPKNLVVSTDNIAQALIEFKIKILENPNKESFSDEMAAEAKNMGIEIIASVEESAYLNLDHPVIVTGHIGKNARINITNGFLIVLGDIDYGAMIDVRDKTNHKNTSISGIMVVGKIGNHARLTALHNIICQSAGDYVQIRAGDLIKTGNIGRGANLMARHLIESGDIGDDLRSTHFVENFYAGNIGARSIIKAGSILVKNIGSGSECIATHSIEAEHINHNSSLTARNLLVSSAETTCQLNAGLIMTQISASVRSTQTA